LGVHNQKLFDPIIERFDHRSDREFWELIVPVDASAGLTVNDIGPVQNALIKSSGRMLRSFRSPRTTNALDGLTRFCVSPLMAFHFRLVCTGPRLKATRETVHSAVDSF
jgi:hypothetical protein